MIGNGSAGNAFYGCSGLKSLTLGTSVEVIGDATFSGCTGLTGELILPESLKSIYSGAFSGCAGFTGVLTIPSGVKSLDGFQGCTGLTGLVLPNGLETIGSLAFNDCLGLTGDLVIPSSVTSIGEYAFSNCEKIIGIEMLSTTTVSTIGANTFPQTFAKNSKNLSIVIQKGTTVNYSGHSDWDWFSLTEKQ